MIKKQRLLIPREKYLSAGVHIGMTSKTKDMKRFIYKIRSNGLAVLNVGILDKKIEASATLMASMQNALVVSRKDIGKQAVEQFAKVTGVHVITKRFMPGSLTNPSFEDFFEPEVLLIIDPAADSQAIKEAVLMRIPIIGLADTCNETKNIDVILPCNNKGKKSIALIFWLLAKRILEKRKEAGQDTDPESAKLEEFGYEPDQPTGAESQTEEE
ncbi:MAG: 30S ribosomal protein S2 [Candidatus Aenigmarchaeota archaeon]|nr:30S ribosomal protein S2 [Candidatus Aenigmarchaeota archaeon]